MTYKKWIIVASSLFLLGLLLGLTVTTGFLADQFTENVTSLEELVSFLVTLPLPLISLIIFTQNVITLLISIIFSPILCIVPIVVLLLNGGLISFVAREAVSQESVGFVLAALLPHGIFEIPAFIIGEAAALSWGATVMVTVLKKHNGNNIVFSLIRNLKIFALAIVILLVAALIETFVTPWVINVVS